MRNLLHRIRFFFWTLFHQKEIETKLEAIKLQFEINESLRTNYLVLKHEFESYKKKNA